MWLGHELHTDLPVLSAKVVFASHYSRPSAIDDSLDCLVGVELVEEAFEDGLVGEG